MKKVAQETLEKNLRALWTKKSNADLLDWYESEEEAKLDDLNNWAWVHLKLCKQNGDKDGEAIYQEMYDTVKDWKKLPEKMPDKKDGYSKPGKTTLTLVTEQRRSQSK